MDNDPTARRPDRATRPEADADRMVRLLGLAFAGADLVFELDAEETIVFAAGAGERLTGHCDASLRGSNWKTLFDPAETELLDALFAGVGPGERMGPVQIALGTTGDRAGRARTGMLSVCRLPQLGSGLSCALSLGLGAAPIAVGPDGLAERDRFETAAERLIEEASLGGLPLALDFIELLGLKARMAGLAPDAADAAHRRLAAVLRAESVRGAGAAALTEERFAVIRPAVATPERLAERVSAAAGPGVRPVTGRLPLDAAARAHTARALRYALDRFIEEGPAAAERSFQTAVRRTVQDSNRFKAVVASGRFGLAYQPVVRLQDQSLHHFEALARFEPGQSPAETIRLAEELDLIVDLDLAVAAKVAAVLETCAPEVRIAVNVSALSLTGAGFVEAFAAVGGASETLRRRLLIEVTETVALTDLGQANAAIAALRKRGHAVCIDDFGAGAASLEYLRRLEVDFVKLDGRYVQDAGATPRDATLLKHFVALCRDLSVATVAEKVETQAGAILLRRLGVDLAQGWAFGKPTPEPKWAPPPAPPRAARRVGANDEWR